MVVRNHAVRRYAERVLGYDLRGSFDDAMAALHRGSGITIEDIRQRIVSDASPGIPATVLFNGTRRVIRGVRAKYVVNNGIIHTCYIGNELDVVED